ncbi:MAG: HU family DNA-binding protein [Rickettsiaceae bacterium]|nr:HU family DNA-binding protein [Rickettsiaceae bacterium]
MNKSEFVSYIAENHQMTKAEATKVIDIFIESVTSALKNKDDVQLIGFGSFSVSDIAARSGHNPQTGETITIPARRQPKFKAGQKLKDACN